MKRYDFLFVLTLCSYGESCFEPLGTFQLSFTSPLMKALTHTGRYLTGPGCWHLSYAAAFCVFIPGQQKDFWSLQCQVGDDNVATLLEMFRLESATRDEACGLNQAEALLPQVRPAPRARPR